MIFSQVRAQTHALVSNPPSELEVEVGNPTLCRGGSSKSWPECPSPPPGCSWSDGEWVWMTAEGPTRFLLLHRCVRCWCVWGVMVWNFEISKKNLKVNVWLLSIEVSKASSIFTRSSLILLVSQSRVQYCGTQIGECWRSSRMQRRGLLKLWKSNVVPSRWDGSLKTCKRF